MQKCQKKTKNKQKKNTFIAISDTSSQKETSSTMPTAAKKKKKKKKKDVKEAKQEFVLLGLSKAGDNCGRVKS